MIDKTILNVTLVTNRIDGTEELSSYISRKVKLKDGANSVKVILDALIPVGSNVNVYARTDTDISLDLEDNVIPFSDQHLWISVPQSSTIVTDDRNIHQEVEYLKDGLGMFMVGAHSMHAAGYITEHEKLMSEKLAYVICGGDLSAPTLVSEQYLLDLERETFLSLCGERKTLERIEHMLKKGKPLRN